MSTNWKIGDKAVFIGTCPHFDVSTGELLPDIDPRPGVIYIVADWFEDEYGHFLTLAGIDDPDEGWISCDFRKVIPVSERATIEQETTV